MAKRYLSVIVPIYNEQTTIRQLVQRLQVIDVVKQIILVDDGSTDGTATELEALAHDRPVVHLRHDENRGKGAAIRTALPRVTEQHVVIQDGDLEYDPRDLPQLLAAMESRDNCVVYGSRYLRTGISQTYRSGGFDAVSGLLAVRTLNLAVQLLYGVSVTDEATCYKLFRTEHLREMNLECVGFEFCSEVTAKIMRMKYEIHEEPIRYERRDRKAGKKIRASDGILALRTLWKFRHWCSSDRMHMGGCRWERYC